MVEKLKHAVGQKPDLEQVAREVAKSKTEVADELSLKVQKVDRGLQECLQAVESLQRSLRGQVQEEIQVARARDADETAHMVRAVAQSLKAESGKAVGEVRGALEMRIGKLEELHRTDH